MEKQIKAFLSTLETEQGYAQNTRKAYTNDLRQFLEFLQANVKREPILADFTPQATKKFLEGEKKSGVKSTTLHRRRVSLKRFAKYLTEQGFLDDDIAEKISYYQTNLWKEISNQKVTCLKSEEIKQLMETVEAAKTPRSYRDLAILSVLLEAGLSIGTLVSLNLSDLNLRTKRMRITSNRDGDFWVSIPTSTKAIQKYLEVGRPELTQSLNEEGLFVSQMGRRITRQGVWQVVRKWGGEAELRRNLNPRMIRHTAARQMIIEDRPLDEIQRLLGHSNHLSTRSLVRRIKRAYPV